MDNRTLIGKERLIELIENMPEEQMTEELVDYLLDNGVIVPPCKIGDRVYFVHDNLYEECAAKVIKIEQNIYTPTMPIWVTIEYYHKMIGRYERKMPADVYEHLCFKTKEEASKHLRMQLWRGEKR